MKRVYEEEKRNFRNQKMKLNEAQEEEKKAFHQWQKDAGLLVDEWDEVRNGPLAHRCLDSVLFILFLNDYKRPEHWNDASKYHQITLLHGDGGDFSNYHYVRCDQLSGSQFDHLIAVSIFNDGELGMFSRVYGWFEPKRAEEDMGGTELDENGLSEYGYSHMKEWSLFGKDAYDDQENILVLKNRIEKPLVPECAFHIGFATSLYVSGW